MTDQIHVRELPRFVRCGARARCIDDRGYATVRTGRMYDVVPDADAEAMGMVRVIDDSGEDYLYPCETDT